MNTPPSTPGPISPGAAPLAGDSRRSGADPAASSPAWARLHLWQVQWVRDLLVLAAVFGLVWLGYRLSIVTIPILLALLLAYLFEPLVSYVTRRKWVGRPFAALAIIVMSTLVVVVPAALGLTFGAMQFSRFAQGQAGNVQALIRAVDQPDKPELIDALPSERWEQLARWLIRQEAKAAVAGAVQAARDGVRTRPEAGQGAGVSPGPPTAREASSVPSEGAPESIDPAQGERDAGMPSADEPSGGALDAVSSGIAPIVAAGVDWLRQNATNLGARAVRAGAEGFGFAARLAGSLGALAFMGFLTLVFFYFFSVSWDRVLCFAKELVPDSKRERVYSLASRMDKVIAGFVRGRLTICACQIVLFTLGYWLIGVPAPLIVGPLVGVLTLVPYAAALGVPVAIVLMWLNPSGEGLRAAWWWIVGAPIVMQGISQVLDDYVLSPKIQGKNTDMSMPLILFASIAGGVLAGFYGLLLAIPVAACAKILVVELVLPRVKAWARGEAQDFLPIER